jgi:spermidine/putrescine transport system substrate-binding protein
MTGFVDNWSGSAPEGATVARAVTRRQFIGRSAGVALTIGGTSGFLAAAGTSLASSLTSKDSGQVNVLSWISYVDPAEAKLWKQAHPNITLNGVAAADDATMFTKIEAGGGSQYDIVFGNCGWTPTYYKHGLIEPLDLTQFSNYKAIYPEFREDTRLPNVLAPNKTLQYPNMWASLSMTWNTTVPYQPSQPYSWTEMWNKHIPSGHVQLMGAGEDFLAMTGLSLGVPRGKIYTMKGAQLQAAVNRLIQLKPYQVNPNVNAQFRQAIISKRAWIGFTSDLSAGPLSNLEAGHTVAKSVIPKEGTLGWIDGPMLVKGAKNRVNALKFIDWWGSNQALLTYLWKSYRFAQCNAHQVERIVHGGGADAKFLLGIKGNQPQLATEIEFQRPPDNPSLWAAAYDRVLA